MHITSLFKKTLVVVYVTAIVASFVWYVIEPNKTVQPTTAKKSVAAERHEDLVLLDAVRVVNADASTLMLSPFFSLALTEPTSCLVARKMEERPDANSPVLAALVFDTSRKCEFARLVRQLTLPVFRQIADVKVVPDMLYTFDAFHAEQWISVGLFDQAATCSLVQQEGMSLGLATKACTRWTPRF